MQRIFISYRRADSADAAGRLYDRLAEQFGGHNVFMDVDDIGPGEDYMVAIERRLANCDTMIVLIGPSWVSASGAAGGRRLDDPHDLARLEVEAGLRREVRVIPILLGDAELPPAADLPEPLRPLLRRQAVRLSHASFHKDVDLLLERLGRRVKRRAAPRRWLWLAAGGSAAILIIVATVMMGPGSAGRNDGDEIGRTPADPADEVDSRLQGSKPDPVPVREPEPEPLPARGSAPQPPAPRSTATVYVAYAGDPYGCLLTVQLTIGGHSFALTTNPFPVSGLAEGPSPYQLAGTIQCTTIGSCVGAGGGTIRVEDDETYNLVWQNVGLAQCSLNLVEGS